MTSPPYRQAPAPPNFNLPNLLTFFRILLVPLLVVVLLTKFEGKEFVGLGVFLLAALTDFLDGFLARRHRQVTRLGKLLDPAADKILTSAAFISLVEINREAVPAWIVVALIAREFAVSALRSFAAGEGIVIAAGWSGKLKTAVQIISISLLIVYSKLGTFRHLAPASLWLALVVSVYSGAEYFWRFGHLVRRSARTSEDVRPLPATQPFPKEVRAALGLASDAPTGDDRAGGEPAGDEPPPSDAPQERR